MPSTYIVVQGDTYDSIARKQYGDDQQAGRIRRTNPGVTDPLVAGSTLVIPDAQVAESSGNRVASSPNEVALTVKGKRFRFWTSVDITLALDATPTVEFDAPFEADNAEFRETFRPFSFHSIEIDVGGDRLFTGTLVNPVPSVGPSARKVTASCYGLSGVMGDCTAPASAYPIEWDRANLRTIAESVTALFGIGAVFEAEAGTTFERVALNPGERVLPWLAKLAAQRDLVIGATAQGDLLFTKARTDGEVVANLTQGVSPVIAVAPLFNPQNFYSSITGLTPTLVGLRGPQHTEKNTHLTGAVRPFTFVSQNTIDADLPTSVRGKMGRMFGGAVSYDLPVSTWRDPSGNLWAPNTLIALEAPGAMVYSRYTFLIRSVILHKTAAAETATLNLVLPGAFAGTIPERLPWEE